MDGRKNAQFNLYDDIELVAITDCGDCPGLLAQRVLLLIIVIKNIGQVIETIHFGTCVKLLMETAGCSMSFNKLKPN